MFNNVFGTQFCSSFGRAFEDLARELVGAVSDNQQPTTDASAVKPNGYIFSDTEGDTVVIDLPGCKKEDLDVNVIGKYVKVEGKRTVNGQEVKYSTYFSTKNDLGNAKLAYADGVLTVTIPAFKKQEPEVKKLTIE